MTAITFRTAYSASPLTMLRRRLRGRGLWFGLILLAALASFEVFNFSTTEYALTTLFSGHSAFGVLSWATVLAVAFCGIDFAGLSRLFTPEVGRKEPKEVWLLTGAWFLGASMNAVMTWWAVGSALAENAYLGNELISREQILHVAPVFLALLVWLTRILIIGAFSFAGDHLFTTADRRAETVEATARPLTAATPVHPATAVAAPPARPAIPEPRPAQALSSQSATRQDGEHASVGAAAHAVSPDRRGTTPLPEFAAPYARAADAPASMPRRYDPPSRFFGPGAGNSRRASVTRPVEPARPARTQTAELEYVSVE